MGGEGGLPMDDHSLDMPSPVAFGSGSLEPRINEMPQDEATVAPVELIACNRNDVELEAMQQLDRLARLPGVTKVIGLPDLHPGPVGTAFVSRSVFYPYVIGNDAGCGMTLVQSDLRVHKVKRDRWTKRLNGLESPWEGDRRAWLEERDVEPGEDDGQLGTIGGGNHFAELQSVEEVNNREAFDALGLSERELLLLVHSGSRTLGAKLMDAYIAERGATGYHEEEAAAAAYLRGQEHALRWAVANRELIAHRFLSQLRADGRRVVDHFHNYLERVEVEGTSGWLHRKGASPADRGPIVIPGSRGTASYLAAPRDDLSHCLNSLPHGAGRKWRRSDCRARLESRFSSQEMKQTALGSAVISEDRKLLYEEAPQAYKNVHAIIEGLCDVGLIRIIARMRPIITYKMRSDRDRRRKKQGRLERGSRGRRDRG